MSAIDPFVDERHSLDFLSAQKSLLTRDFSVSERCAEETNSDDESIVMSNRRVPRLSSW